MERRERIGSIKDIGVCLQSIIKSRYNKNVKLIYTKGLYKSLYVSFYKNYVFQFYVEDRHNKFVMYPLKNETVIRKDYLYKDMTVDVFYQRLLYFLQRI